MLPLWTKGKNHLKGNLASMGENSSKEEKFHNTAFKNHFREMSNAYFLSSQTFRLNNDVGNNQI